MWLWPIAGLVLVGSLWTLNWVAAPQTGTPESGTFGDQFGAVNALFSGLAFAGIIYTLVLQRKDLRMQREEMQMQREEMQMQREERGKSREEFEQQNFQSMFFGLMKHQQELFLNPTARISFLNLDNFKDIENWSGSGHELFRVLNRQLINICESLEHEKFQMWTVDFGRQLAHKLRLMQSSKGSYSGVAEKHLAEMAHTNKSYEIKREWWEAAQLMSRVERHRLAYSILFQSFNYILSPYFRHLYHILRFLKESKERQISRLLALKGSIGDPEYLEELAVIEAQFKTFANFLQAQLSPQELFLFFHNAICFEEHFMPLVQEFELLENLDEEDLLGIRNGDVPGLNFKSRKDLIQNAIDIAKTSKV